MAHMYRIYYFIFRFEIFEIFEVFIHIHFLNESISNIFFTRQRISTFILYTFDFHYINRHIMRNMTQMRTFKFLNTYSPLEQSVSL